MARERRRGLFWQVYLTLLASLVLLSLLAAAIMHLLMGGPPHAVRVRMRENGGVHALGVLLAMAIVVGLAAYPVVSRITSRLEALRRSVEAWGAGDHRRRAMVDGRDEIAAVATSFNAAADRADDLLTAHKTLLMHASHELRSPLARLAMAAEMYAGGDDPARSGAMRREIAELDALVGEILLASRLDFAAEPGDAERVDCLALAAEETARAGVVLEAVEAAASGFDVLGSPRLLRRMIRNLIDNALKHGAPPVEVELVRGALGGKPGVTIHVRDHGPGIPAGLRERVFEPFFRPDGWAEEAGGWGLGLSLVRQIARRHGGEARVTSSGGVTTFTVDLPGA
jgi:two-component system OmpR family sensor kinase